METKKSKKSDIERIRTVFFQTGFLIALAVSLIALEWPSKPGGNNVLLSNSGKDVFEPDIVNTFYEQEQIAPPPPPKIIETFELVPDHANVDNHISFDVGADESTAMDQTWFDLGGEENIEDSIFYNPEINPAFKGGSMSDFRDYIVKHVEYPAEALRAGVEGTITIKFTIGKDGKVKEVVVVRGVHPALDNAVRKVIMESEGWMPGMQSGRPVNVTLFIPVKFYLI